MGKAKLTGVSKVFKEKANSSKPNGGVGQGSGQPGPMGGGSGQGNQATPQPGGLKKEKKKGPGKIVLSDDEKLPKEYIEKIKQALENPDQWDHGKTSSGKGDPTETTKAGVPGGGEQPESDKEGRTWGEMPKDENVEQKIDQAIKEAQRRAAEKERKTDTEKTKGGAGQGGFRDRVMLQDAARTDWAKIFESRLTEYSRETSKHLPYTRRLSGGPLGRTLPSSTESRDVLPETNIVIDTSSSLSYAELETILTELKHALISAKISLVNVILWTETAYWSNTYKDITSTNFQNIINDIQKNWRGGGNNIDNVYEFMIKKGWTKKFTLHFTDGWIRDHREGKTRQLSYIVHDPANTIFGIIYPSQRISWSDYMRTADMFPGEKVPIFLDTKKFGV